MLHLIFLQITIRMKNTKYESSIDSSDSDGSSDLGIGFEFGTFSDQEEDILYSFQRKKGTDESMVEDAMDLPMELAPYWADPWVVRRLCAPFRCIDFAQFFAKFSIRQSSIHPFPCNVTQLSTKKSGYWRHTG